MIQLKLGGHEKPILRSLGILKRSVAELVVPVVRKGAANNRRRTAIVWRALLKFKTLAREWRPYSRLVGSSGSGIRASAGWLPARPSGNAGCRIEVEPMGFVSDGLSHT